VLQSVAACSRVLQWLQCAAMRYSVLLCVAECCSVLQCVAVYCSLLQCVAVCLHCVARERPEECKAPVNGAKVIVSFTSRRARGVSVTWCMGVGIRFQTMTHSHV